MAGRDEDRERDDDPEVHSLFASLRREMADISRAFQERVLEAMEEADRSRSAKPPSFSRLLQSVLFEALNMVAAYAGAESREPERKLPEKKDEP